MGSFEALWGGQHSLVIREVHNIVALLLTTLPVVLKVPHESSYQTPVSRPVP